MICISIGHIDQLRSINELRPSLLELRFDLLEQSPGEIIPLIDPAIKLIATCRPDKYSDYDRIKLFGEALALGVSYIDLEIESEDSFVKELASHAKTRDTDLIISYHNFAETPGEDALKQILNSCFKKGGDIAKIACMVNNERDNAALMALYGVGGRKVVIGMGEKGKITRFASLKMGAEFTFASLGKAEETAPGQLTYDELISLNKILDKT